MKKANYLYLLIFSLFILCTISNGIAQETGSLLRSRGSVYYLGDEDELLIPVNIWGFVRLPGQYHVPNNTDLVSLLSYAGGPTENAKISNIRIVRTDPRRGNIIYTINVKRFIETADERLIPPLKPGDTIIVKGTTFYWISKFFEFVARLATFAQIFYFVAIASRYLD
jgi:polysaccharide export outer membrane protein